MPLSIDLHIQELKRFRLYSYIIIVKIDSSSFCNNYRCVFFVIIAITEDK
jgi:hypothetical protein